MSYNGSGLFTLYSPGNPVVTGTTISSTWANNTLSDIATGLSTALTKNGQTTATTRIPFVDGISTFGVNLDGSAGASQVGFTTTGTGAVATTTQAQLRGLSFRPENYGAVGDGTTDDTTAINNALTASVGGTLYLTASYLVTAITIPGAIKITGPGKFIGAAVSAGSTPSATISATGTLATGVAYGSTIAIDDVSFTVSNSFGAGDWLLLSNNPAAVASRRLELLEVVVASGSAFTVGTGVLQTYGSTTSLQFRKVTPIESIVIECGLENITFQPLYCRNVSLKPFRAKNLHIDFKTCWQFEIDCTDWDATNTGCIVSSQGMCRNFQIRGNYSGGRGVSDNGIVKTNGAAYYTVDANITGTVNGGGFMHGFMADTYYAGNPSGYDYQANAYFYACINSRTIYGSAVFLTAQSTPTDVQPHDFYLTGQWGANGSNVVYGRDGIIAGNATGGVLQLDNTTRIIVQSDNYASYNLTGTNTSLEGIWVSWAPTITGTTGTAPEPTMSVATKGQYRKRGRSIDFHAIYDWSSAGSRTGNLRLNTPPFTSKNIANLESPIAVGYTVGLTVTNGVHVSVQPGLQNCVVYNNGVTQQAITGSGTITVNGSYETDS